MKAKFGLAVLSILPFFLGCFQNAWGQTAPGVFADANQPAGAPDPQKSDDIWNVDPINDQVSINIPFTTTPVGGRGPKIPFALLYNSASTVTLQTSGTVIVGYGAGSPVTSFKWSAHPIAWGGALTAPTGPWTTTGPYFYSSYSNVPNMGFTDTNGNYHVTGNGCLITSPYTYVDESGGSHDLNLMNFSRLSDYDGNLGWAPPCGPAQSASTTNWPTSSTSDGSAVASGNNIAIGPDGTSASGSRLTDSNGNYAYIASTGGVFTATDALNRAAYKTNIPIGLPGQIPAGSYYFTTYDTSGNPQTYTVTISTIAIGSFTMPHPTVSELSSPAYCTSCSYSYSIQQATAGDTLTAITEIDRPNGTSYKFTYDSTFGTISKITFPTGGYVRFVWGIRDKDWSPYSQYNVISSTVVTDVYVSDGSGEKHWTYDMKSLSTNSTPFGRVHAPDSSWTDYTGTCFVYTTIAMYQFQARASCKEASRATYSSTGTLMKSVGQNFNAHGLPLQIATTMYDGGSGLQQLVQNTYDGYDNPIEKDESEFYACSSCLNPTQSAPLATPPPNGWLRKTFVTFSNSTLTGAHIVNKPSQVLITDGGGHPYSLTTYGYDQTAVGGQAGYTNHDDTNYGVSSLNARGNLTTESRCSSLASTSVVTPSTAASACSQWLSTTHTYDLTGLMTSTKDPQGNTTTFSYTDSYYGGTPTNTHGYLTQVTYATGYTDKYTYYYRSGQVATHTDSNTATTNYFYNDPGDMGRQTETKYPDGGDVQISYDDAAPPSATITTATGETAGPIVKTTQYDQLGRQSQAQLTSDPSGTVYVDTQYDSKGRVYRVSNPYRAGDTEVWTVNSVYDGLDRVRTITNPDGTTKQFTYTADSTGSIATSTDENGNQWAKKTNGLGQMVWLKEPSVASKTPTMETDYVYDPLSNLISVKQWGGLNGSPATNGPINRTFAYNGVSWLVAASNPETSRAAKPASLTCPGAPSGTSWTLCYGYDGNGNVTSRIDNRGTTTNYGYDAVNHLISKTYSSDTSSTPFSCYQYGSTSSGAGNIGRLINAWTQRSALGSCAASPPPNGYLTLRHPTSYDAMGRVTGEQQCTVATCTSGARYQPVYTYNLAGSLRSYSNGITTTPTVGTLIFTNTYDSAGRPLTVKSNWNSSTTLFSAQTATTTRCPGSLMDPYAAFGGLQNAVIGNGLTLNRTYDKRQRMTCESDMGSQVINATNGSASLVITGTEQSR